MGENEMCKVTTGRRVAAGREVYIPDEKLRRGRQNEAKLFRVQGLKHPTRRSTIKLIITCRHALV